MHTCTANAGICLPWWMIVSRLVLKRFSQLRVLWLLGSCKATFFFTGSKQTLRTLILERVQPFVAESHVHPKNIRVYKDVLIAGMNARRLSGIILVVEAVYWSTDQPSWFWPVVEQPICLCGLCLRPARLIPSHASIPLPLHLFEPQPLHPLSTSLHLFHCSVCVCVYPLIHSLFLPSAKD